MMKGIETLAKDFFSNRNVCEAPKELKEGDACFILDTELIDQENEFYAIIPVKVLAVDPRPSVIPGRKYYWFAAEGSKVDEQLNVHKEGELVFYKYLENTSPYILLSDPTTAV